ncbi:MAG: hypothetical protein FWE82_05120 [Defluviitaleaceae bacterium]|nr:hypothetical protein [Defluviitaleaceae bacterium]
MPGNLTGRERVLAALNFEETDRVPIDIGGMGSTGINAIAYRNLRKHFGLPGLVKVYDVYQQLGWVDDDAKDILGGDVAQVFKRRGAFGISRENWKQGEMTDGSECLVPEGFSPVKNSAGQFVILDENGNTVGKRATDSHYYDGVFFPYGKAETEAGIDAVPMDYFSEEDLAFIEKQAAVLKQKNDRAVLLDFGGDILGAGQNNWGFEKFMEYMITEPGLVRYYLNKLTECHMENLKNVLNRAGRHIDVINFCDDLGSQQAPQLSPAMYREIILPCHRRQFGFVRANYPHIKVFLHSCGAIKPLLPDLIDAGLQIINPVQISARGMDPAVLKREFGRDLVFWGGGADMQSFVPFAAASEIKKHAEELICVFAKGGGFVFSQIHNIQADVPPDKIAAIFSAAKKYVRQFGGY